MKRNFKSIVKYLVLILITALATTVFFKLSKLFDNNDGSNMLLEMAVASKQSYSNQTLKIDWHDWELISMEKLRTGKIILIIYILNIYNTIIYIQYIYICVCVYILPKCIIGLSIIIFYYLRETFYSLNIFQVLVNKE